MKPSLSVSIKRVSLAIGSAITVLGATACASSPGIATPLRAAPEPAVSPPASTSLAGSVIAFAGSPEGIAIDAAGDVAVNVRNPDGVVIFPIGSPTDRKFVPLDGSARHLNLAGAYGPLLVPDETANMLIELALPSGDTLESIAVGNHPHDAIAVGPATVFVADELANTIHVITDGRVARVVPAPLQPGGMADNDAGTRALVVGVRARRISEYTAAGDLVGSANCGAGPTHVVAGDNGIFWVADTYGAAVLGFELGPRGPVQVANIPVGSHPYGLAFDTDRDTLWVTVTGDDKLLGLHLIGRSVASRTVYNTVRQPNTVAVDETTGELVVTGSTDPGQLQFLSAAASS